MPMVGDVGKGSMLGQDVGHGQDREGYFLQLGSPFRECRALGPGKTKLGPRADTCELCVKMWFGVGVADRSPSDNLF